MLQLQTKMSAKRKNHSSDVKLLVEELLEKIGIEGEVDVQTSKSEDSDEDTLLVNVSSEKEAGLMIGSHGATLHAIQSFIAMAMRQKTGDWVRVVVDIGDWRQKHEEHLEGLAKQAAERARATGEPQHLYNLTPSQRRVVHMALTKEKGIHTESEGEGEGRYLIVQAK